MTAVPGALPPEAADLLAQVARAIDDQQAWAWAGDDVGRHDEWLCRRACLVWAALSSDVAAGSFAGAGGLRAAGEGADWLRCQLDRHDAAHPVAGGTAEVAGKQAP